MKRHLALSLPLLVFTGPALAGSFCAPLGSVKGTLCSGNSAFVEAAGSCLSSLSASIQRQQAVLGHLMSQANSSSALAQDAKVANHVANLDQAARTLDQLIDQAHQAKADMLAYAGAFALPGSYDRDTLQGLGLLDTLKLFPCIAENEENLAESIVQVNQQIAQLKSTRQTVAELSGASSGVLGRLKDSPGGPRAAGPAAPDIPGGKSADVASTVTGQVWKGRLASSGSQSRGMDPVDPSALGAAKGPSSAATLVTAGRNGSHPKTSDVVVGGTDFGGRLEDRGIPQSGSSDELRVLELLSAAALAPTGQASRATSTDSSAVTEALAEVRNAVAHISTSTSSEAGAEAQERYDSAPMTALGEADLSLFDRVHRVLRKKNRGG